MEYHDRHRALGPVGGFAFDFSASDRRRVRSAERFFASDTDGGNRPSGYRGLKVSDGWGVRGGRRSRSAGLAAVSVGTPRFAGWVEGLACAEVDPFTPPGEGGQGPLP